MFGTNDRISEEAFGDISSFLNDPFVENDLGFDLLVDDPIGNIPVSGFCDFPSPEPLLSAVEPNEFINTYLGPLTMLQTSSVESDNKRALISNQPINPLVRKTSAYKHKIPIPLSQSVGVGTPQKIHNTNSKLQIVNQLEESFRPRYKSDYFAQNGNSRKPRYVADRKGNHFVTIQVPVGIRGQILIHWLTLPDKSGERYIMPYRFQASNDSLEVPDCNPLKLDIKTDKNGLMRLYLVLIKSKQDELKASQPLQVFQPFREAFNMPTKNTQIIYNPKQLIQEYKLDQSQLAFTFCGLSTDGKNFIPEWDTTVLSTVMHELPPENAKSKSVSCPQCKHQFEISVNTEQEYVQESNTKKRKVNRTTTDKKIKRKIDISNEYPFIS